MATTLISERIWREIESLARLSPKLAAIAYVSDSPVAFRSGDTLVTDASRAAIATGQTSAPVLLRAANAGATVYSLPQLHAKILVAAKAALIGSANLSRSSRRLAEAGILTTDPRIVRETKRLVTRLSRRGRRLSLGEIRELCKIPVLRPNGRAPASEVKLSLLQALQRGSPMLDTLAFSWYTTGTKLTRKHVEDAARKRRVPLPPQRRWEWYESDLARGGVRRLRRICEGRALVSWEVEKDEERDCIQAFKPHDRSAAHFIDALVQDGIVVSLYASALAKIPFDIRRDRKRLAAVLTAGMETAPAALRRAVSKANYGILSLAQVQKLVALGSTAV